ncbi:cytochrome P450 [Capsaspora owczarzaki ATCC 30864]|uniref:Cytochrome P450 n=1 Tax=Capsaspora owczarzaki (strain ATCC 30864) TaxID=595528 RepID=A0A0D2WSL5_CAPO3|nr:cytochrome P450 [Capsaspora owczarzaki ATCC 30864]KJE95200.1 cytochrome P450 [Capsaspora owczarzaki ATCC 30864]|eukprot:XP_004346351.1 cytochrome P450 [Capsaspora owczarzaki ATCC 30864]
MLLQAILFAAVAALAFVYFKVRGTAPFLDFPGPPRHWFWQNARQVTKVLHARHDWWRAISKEYGNIVYYRSLGINILNVSDPEILDQVFKNYTIFPSRALKNPFVRVLPLGLVAMETSDRWSRHRRLLSPLFAEKFMEVYATVFIASGERLFKQWHETPRGTKINIYEAFIRLTLDIIGLTGFGYNFAALDNPDSRYVHAGQEILDEIVRLNLLPKPIAALDRAKKDKLRDGMKAFEDVVDDVVKANRAGGNDEDETSKNMLSELLRMQDEEGKLTREEVHDEIITLMIAGHETTANTMSWAIFQLARNPSVQAKLRQEIETVLEGRPPKYEDRKNLPYTEWVIKESLRMYPTLPIIPREAMADTEIRGKLVPKGTWVQADLVSMHSDPKIWGDPETFRPERFDESNPDNNRHPAAFMPFGGGRRICIGQRFAFLEATLVLARAIQQFEFRMDPDQQVTGYTDISYGPKIGLLVDVIPIQPKAE